MYNTYKNNISVAYENNISV